MDGPLAGGEIADHRHRAESQNSTSTFHISLRILKLVRALV
jgi:hypothetical protein